MDMDELLAETTAQAGAFADWVKVEPNRLGGVDITNTNSGECYRVAVDDETVYLHVFINGKARLLNGTLTFNGMFAAPEYVAAALVNLL